MNKCRATEEEALCKPNKTTRKEWFGALSWRVTVT